ncbi:UDP-N-acetylmuramoyl-tripeptide--D-alanyl-D-alanine ligase [Patescibacteria group bacterium]
MIILKKILEWKLQIVTRLIIKKYQPKIVGVTGSVGKTSTKEAIYTVLKSKFRTGKNLKNYNNEIGVPLAILGEETGGKNPFIWFGIFWRAFLKILFRDDSYPEILAVEMGADKAGDIGYLTKLAPCTVGVVTAVSGVHMEFFKSFERVVSEKRKIISHLPKDGYAILNTDDPEVIKMKEKTKAKVLTYGFSEQADIRGIDPQVSHGPPDTPKRPISIQGISFKVAYDGSTVPMFLPSVLGRHQVLGGLAAVAVGVAFSLNLHDIATALKEFVSPPGRMNLLPGIKYTSLIDDSYNSSPKAAIAALDTLKLIDNGGKKIAALGDMAELGSESDTGHEEVGKHAAISDLDILVTVGEKAKVIAQSARESGMSADRVVSYDHAEQAGRYIQKIIDTGDVVLIKGSQVARMEKVTKELMTEPLRAKDLLVRQGAEWQ